MIEPKWKYKHIDDASVNETADIFNLPVTIARVMALRGIDSREVSREFFSL